MTPADVEEYRALRATIRERGTTRVWVFTVGLVGWAGLTVATAALGGVPVATLVPLLVLAGTFEAVFALHIGVERIGRYIQAFHESDSWERTISAFGRGVHGSATDPLFVWVFAVATLLNFVPVMLAGPVAIEVYAIGGRPLRVPRTTRDRAPRRDAPAQGGARALRRDEGPSTVNLSQSSSFHHEDTKSTRATIRALRASWCLRDEKAIAPARS